MCVCVCARACMRACQSACQVSGTLSTPHVTELDGRASLDEFVDPTSLRMAETITRALRTMRNCRHGTEACRRAGVRGTGAWMHAWPTYTKPFLQTNSTPLTPAPNLCSPQPTPSTPTPNPTRTNGP